jgi:hypothetical protein
MTTYDELKQKATPGEWVLDKQRHEVVDSTGKDILPTKANLELIVLMRNSFDGLIDALEQARAHLTVDADRYGVRAKVNAALALARGEAVKP